MNSRLTGMSGTAEKCLFSEENVLFRGETENSIKEASIFLDYTFFILDSYGFHFWQQGWFSLFDDLPITSSSWIERVTILLNLLMKFPSYRYHFPKRCQNLNRAERLVGKIAWSQVTSAHWLTSLNLPMHKVNGSQEKLASTIAFLRTHFSDWGSQEKSNLRGLPWVRCPPFAESRRGSLDG